MLYRKVQQPLLAKGHLEHILQRQKREHLLLDTEPGEMIRLRGSNESIQVVIAIQLCQEVETSRLYYEINKGSGIITDYGSMAVRDKPVYPI